MNISIFLLNQFSNTNTFTFVFPVPLKSIVQESRCIDNGEWMNETRFQWFEEKVWRTMFERNGEKLFHFVGYFAYQASDYADRATLWNRYYRMERARDFICQWITRMYIHVLRNPWYTIQDDCDSRKWFAFRLIDNIQPPGILEITCK